MVLYFQVCFILFIIDQRILEFAERIFCFINGTLVDITVFLYKFRITIFVSNAMENIFSLSFFDLYDALERKKQNVGWVKYWGVDRPEKVDKLEYTINTSVSLNQLQFWNGAFKECLHYLLQPFEQITASNEALKPISQ